MFQLFKPGTYDRNGVPFSAILNQDKQVVTESLKISNLHGEKTTAVQNRSGFIGAPNQSTPQIFSTEAPSMGMNNRINSTEAKNSGMPKTNGTNTGLLITVSNKQQKKKIKGSTRKRFDRLLKEGIPHEEARSLCRLPWIILEKMLLNNTHHMTWVNNSEPLQGPANKNHEQNSDVVPVRVSTKVPNFQGAKTIVAQKFQNRPGLPIAPIQSSPQIFSKEALSMAKKSTEAKDSEMYNSNIEMGKTRSIDVNEADTTNTDTSFNWKKISRSARKRYHRLKEEGIPQDEARRLCRMPSSTLNEILLNHPRKRKNSEDQGPASKNLKISDTDGQNSDVPLRVGITNSNPMSEDQMKMLRRHLILAIKERCSKGEGPQFLGFSHKAGWVLVTCTNQRSKEWLVHEIPYQGPWPEARLSIIPDDKLPKPPTAVTFIPEAVAPSVEEALSLLKMQNFGLNTELWKVRYEKVENEGRTLSFTLDDPSADVLRTQNCQAAIGIKMVSFKIKGQYRPYNPKGNQNQVLANSNQGAMPGSSKPQVSQSFGVKCSHHTIVTSKDGPFSAARRQLPQATGKVVQRQEFQPSAEKTLFALGSRGIMRDDPAPLALQRLVPQTREFGPLPIIQNSNSHGTFQKDQRGPVIGEPSTSARGLAFQAARDAVQPMLDSLIGTPFIQGSGSAGGTVFGSDGSVLAMRRLSEKDSSSLNGPSFGHGRTSSINQNTNSTQAPGGMYQTRNTSLNHGGFTFAFNKGGTAIEQAPQGKGIFGARPSPNPLRETNPLTQRKEGLTESSQASFPALARGLSQAGNLPSIRRTPTLNAIDPPGVGRTLTLNRMDPPRVGSTSTMNRMNPPRVGRTLVHNGMGAATVSARNSFSGPSQTMFGFGGRPIIVESQFGTRQEKHGEVDRTSDCGSALTNQEPSQFEVPIIQETQREAFDQCNVVHLTVTDTDEPDRESSPGAEGGYHTWVIEDLETYGTRTQNVSGTGTLTSATEPSLASYRHQSHDVGHGSRRVSIENTLDGLPQSRDWIESRSSPFQDGRTANEQEQSRRGQLPSSKLENHNPRFSGSGIDRMSMSVMAYEARGFGAGVQNPKDKRPLQSSGTLSDGESRGLWSQPHTNSFLSRAIESKSQTPFQSSATVNVQDSSLHNEHLPHPSGGFVSRTIESGTYGRSYHRDRLSVTDSRVQLPQASCYEDQDPRGRLFRDKFNDRESSDRSPHARCGYDVWTIEDPESYRRTPDWNGSSTDTF